MNLSISPMKNTYQIRPTFKSHENIGLTPQGYEEFDGSPEKTRAAIQEELEFDKKLANIGTLCYCFTALLAALAGGYIYHESDADENTKTQNVESNITTNNDAFSLQNDSDEAYAKFVLFNDKNGALLQYLDKNKYPKLVLNNDK